MIFGDGGWRETGREREGSKGLQDSLYVCVCVCVCVCTCVWMWGRVRDRVRDVMHY